MNCVNCENILDPDCRRCVKQLQAENERSREALEKIQQWQQAYPIAVFPKPDFKKAHAVLKAAGMTLDAISASNMRHVLNGIKGIVEQGLKRS